MTNDSFQITYPAVHAGAGKSDISFNRGTPDPVRLLEPGTEHADGRRRFFVTDATVASLECMREFTAGFDDGVRGDDCLIILGSGEPYKTMESVLTIVAAAVDAGFSRNDMFVGIGGGVICDITSFAASLFKRGSSVMLVPTTLLAMVDASIGGKTGCDFDSYKNMVGTFFPAGRLHYYPEFVQYLPENQYNSGLAEAFKTALLYDSELYGIFRGSPDLIKRRDKELLDTIIRRCVRAKAAAVEKDFMERDTRRLLNLGHTFGHALETVAGLGTVTHGAAVAWGIGRAAALSFRKEYCREAFIKELFGILSEYGWNTEPVPAAINGGGAGERLLAVMHKDKKNMNGRIRLVLPRGLNDTVIEEFDDNDILSVLR